MALLTHWSGSNLHLSILSYNNSLSKFIEEKLIIPIINLCLSLIVSRSKINSIFLCASDKKIKLIAHGLAAEVFSLNSKFTDLAAYNSHFPSLSLSNFSPSPSMADNHKVPSHYSVSLPIFWFPSAPSLMLHLGFFFPLFCFGVLTIEGCYHGADSGFAVPSML